MINRSLATRIVLTGGVCAWLTASGDAGARIYTTRRHPETQRGSNDLRRLQLSTVAANPGCGQEQREAFVVQHQPRLYQHHRQSESLSRIPDHAGHLAGNKYQLIALRQPGVPSQVRLRAVQP